MLARILFGDRVGNERDVALQEAGGGGVRQELAALEAIEFDVVDLDTVLKAATLRHGLEGVRFELEWIERVRRDVADYAAKAGESEGRDGERDGGDG